MNIDKGLCKDCNWKIRYKYCKDFELQKENNFKNPIVECSRYYNKDIENKNEGKGCIM